MPNNFVNDIIKNINGQIEYKNSLSNGEITADNGDGTYNVKIALVDSAYPNVSTNNPDATFLVGQSVIIGFKVGNKENPVIMGNSEELLQTPKQVEVDYSGGCAVVETVEVTIYCASASGFITVNDNDYDVCHDTIDGDDADNITIDTASLWIDQIFGGGTYAIERSYILFDTSAIPTGATITSAILKLYCVSKATTTDFNVVIQNGQPNYPHNPLVNSDYDYSKYSNNGGQKLASTFTLNAYNEITLNSNGIAWINKGGITKLCLRNSLDIAKVTPTDDTSYIGFIASEVYSGKTDYAKLTITYTI